jgi:heterodisulfide reductase subunit C
VGENILNKGYCIHPDIVAPEMHPEQGPIWKWVCDNKTKVYERLQANLDKQGAGTLRKIHQKNLDELSAIFYETGGIDLYDIIEKFSQKQARKLLIMTISDMYVRIIVEIILKNNFV